MDDLFEGGVEHDAMEEADAVRPPLRWTWLKFYNVLDHLGLEIDQKRTVLPKRSARWTQK